MASPPPHLPLQRGGLSARCPSFVRRGWGGRIPERSFEILKHSIKIAHDVVIRVPDHSQPQRLEIGFSLLVPHDLRKNSVRISVNLDHQFPLRAVKINNIRTDPVLTSELQGSELFQPQLCPELGLRGRHP
jgi:hypothetical protein